MRISSADQPGEPSHLVGFAAVNRWIGKSNRIKGNSGQTRRDRRQPRRLRMEVLEARRVLATYIVDTLADTADGICGIDGVGNINCSLRSAIIAANNNPGADIIRVPAGTYTLTINNDSFFDATEGSLDVLDSVSIVGMTGTPGDVIIDGNNLDSVFRVEGTGVSILDVRFESLTIQNGLAQEEGGGIQAAFTNLQVVNSVLQNNRVLDPSFAFAGGAIFADDASLVLDRSVIRNNSVSSGNGGGVAFFASAGYGVDGVAYPTGGAIVVVDTRFEGNIADTGGGLFIAGTDPGSGSVAVLERAVFDQNEATVQGGGAFIAGIGRIAIDDGEFTANRAGGPSGGGISILPEQVAIAGAIVTINGTSFRNNQAGLSGNLGIGNGGGAISAASLVFLEVRGAEFIENSVGPGAGSGGAIRARAELLIEDSEFRNNQVAAGFGGGVAFTGAANAGLTIRRTTFANNSASQTGGALDAVGDFNGAVLLDTVTFDQNFSGLSGGGAYVYVVGAVDIVDSQFLRNTTNEAGGGLYLLDTGPVLISQSLFDGNIANGGGGGGLALLTDAAVEDSVFRNNQVTSEAFAFDEGGGGISIAQDVDFQPTVTVLRSSILNNLAPLGGGIGSANANLTVTNSTIANNNATNTFGGGGGIGFTQDNTFGSLPRVTLSVIDSLIQRNLSAADAAGIGIADADASILRTTVELNIANGRAGGIGIIGNSNSPTLSIEQSTISRNQAGANGGGIAAVNAGLQALNVTVSDNTSDGFGGGVAYSNNNDSLSSLIAFTTIASNSTLTGQGSNVASDALPLAFASSLIADPIGVNASGTNFLAGPGNIQSASFNLDSDGSGGFSSLGDQSNVDPRIGPLANYGGPVQTRALLAGSPAIDGSDTPPLAVDARGFVRPQDGNADGEARNDIGAFEAAELFLDAEDDFFTVVRGSSSLLQVLDNDATSAPPLRIVSASLTTNGSVSIVDNQILYTANETFVGFDVFTYTITNSPIGVDTPVKTALVTVTVEEGNRPPTLVSLSNNTVPSDSAVGTIVGQLSADDPDLGETLTYTLVAGIGDEHNAAFTILGDALLTAETFDFEIQDSYSIRVRSTDSGGLFAEQTFVIGVDPVLRFRLDAPIDATTAMAVTIDGETLTTNDIAGAQSPIGIVSIASVTSTTAEGGSVMLVGQQLTYTSSVGFEGIDTVEYVITDGFSTTAASLQINVMDIVEPEIDLATSTVGNLAQVNVGDSLTFTVAVNNLSSTIATDVIVVTSVGSLASIDSFVAPIGTSVAIDSVNDMATWTLPSIPPLTSLTYTLNAVANTPGSLTTASVVSSAATDPDLTNNSSTVSTIISNAMIELHTLSTGSGDGDIQIDVDAFGRFGTAAFGSSDQQGTPTSVADFDPVGPFGSAEVVFDSKIGIRAGAIGPFAPLGPATPGVTITRQIDGSITSALSAFVVGQLSVSLDQSVAPTFLGDGNRAGAQLRQGYTITNNSDGPTSFDLARFIDADMEFENSFSSDGGGILVDSTGKLIAFITDRGGTASDNTPFVAITAVGGEVVTSNRFDIDQLGTLTNRLFNEATPLRDAVSGDINADGFVDAAEGYDSAAALRNVFTLLPGQSIVYVTDTIFGIRPDSLTPPTASGDLNGHVFCDINDNGIEDLGEAAAGAFVFVDLNGNRIFDSVLGEPHTFADLQGNYSMFVDNLSPGQLANVVVVNPDGCFPNVPEIGVTRHWLSTGMLSRDVATIFNPQTGLDEILVINELGNDLVRVVQGSVLELQDPYVVSSTTPLGKRPFALSVYQPSGQSPTIAVAALGVGSDPGSLFVINAAGISEFPAGNGPIAVVVDDFDGDGAADFITASFRDGKILARLSSVAEPIEIAEARVPRSITKADINGDSHLDLVVVATGFAGDNSSEVIVLIGDGLGGFTPLRDSVLRGEAIDVVAANYDGAGGDELVIANFSGSVDIYGVNATTGILSRLTSLAVAPGITAVAADDLNGDGILDLVTVNPKAETIEIFIGQEDGSFLKNRTIHDVATPAALAIGNFDGDSLLDIAVANLFASSKPYRLPSTVTILGLTVSEREVTLSPTAPTTADFGFTQFPSTPLAQAPLSAFRHDINGDGIIAPLDALMVLNAVREHNASEGETVRSARLRYKSDVNGDGVTTPLDALLILNQIARDQRLAALRAEGFDDDEEQRIDAIDQVMAEALLF